MKLANKESPVLMVFFYVSPDRTDRRDTHKDGQKGRQADERNLMVVLLFVPTVDILLQLEQTVLKFLVKTEESEEE